MKPLMHKAFTDTTVCPDLVPVSEYGHHTSRPMLREIGREWKFTTKQFRDDFVQAVIAGKFRRSK